MGAIAVATGISGLMINGTEPHGGVATKFYVLLSVVTLTASWVSVALGDGIGERGAAFKRRSIERIRVSYRTLIA